MKYIFKLFFVFVFVNNGYTQKAIKQDYDKYLVSGEIGGYKSILDKAETGNSNFFILIGSFIDANNTMFKKTKDFKYLKYNQNVYNALKNKKKFFAKFRKNEQNYEINNQESILMEGYLFRYLAEYFYILSKIDERDLYSNKLDTNSDFVEERILYWNKLSLEKTLDDSFFQGIRVHMGANWATCFLYLSVVSKNEKCVTISKKYLERFDSNFRKNLKEKTYDKKGYYSWNSTWDTSFTNSLKKRQLQLKEKPEIQDTSHGNHLVVYIIASSELKMLNWKQKDLNLLANTLTLKIYDKQGTNFNDLIDGVKGNKSEFKKTGWKQSDGWMKLANYYPKLKQIYIEYYSKNKDFLVKTNAYNQFLANLYSNEI